MVARGYGVGVWGRKEVAGKDCVRRWGREAADKGPDWRAPFGVIQPVCNCETAH